jgi:predicted transcriptional regulator
MKQKDRYTLQELFNNLDITFTELKNRAGISDVTLAKIRDGYSARRSTINTLLRTFSEIYNIELSLDNVTGIVIKDKIARQEQATRSITEKAIEPPVPSSMGEDTAPKKKAV